MPINPVIIEGSKELVKVAVASKVMEKAVEKTAQLIAVPLIEEVGRASRNALLKNAAIQIGVATAIQVAPSTPSVVTNLAYKIGYKGFSRGFSLGQKMFEQSFALRMKEASLPALVGMVHEIALTNPQYNGALMIIKGVSTVAKFVGTISIAVVVTNIIIAKYTLYQTLLGFISSARGELTNYLTKGLDYGVYNKALYELACCKTVQEVQVLMLSINKIAINS